MSARWLSWLRHGSCIEEKWIGRFWWENLKGRDHKEDLASDESIILKSGITEV
jgi:hypothetical protein